MDLMEKVITAICSLAHHELQADSPWARHRESFGDGGGGG